MCFKHLNYEQRKIIEKLNNNHVKPYSIAKFIGVSPKTIYNELKRGQYQRLSSDLIYYSIYSADIAQGNYNYNATAKGRPLNIGNNHKLAKDIENLIINKRYSPYHAMQELDCNFCLSTFYSYIDKGIFEHLTNKHLAFKTKIKSHEKKVLKQNRYGVSIEQRPTELNERASAFHWEMDLVIGNRTKERCLLVLTERKTRAELIYPIVNKSAFAVNSVLHRLKSKRYFKDIFKSITVDNGSEFAMTYEMEHNINGKKVTQVYYCHPYTSCERGSNENQNRLIRRFIPKGQSMKNVTQKQCNEIAEYMNNMHRKLFNGKTSKQLFNELSPIPIENLYNL